MTPSWLDEFLLPGGKLGLVHSPGSREATTAQDLDALSALGVQRIICLQEAFELEHFRVSETMDQRRAAVEQRGIAFTHSPVVDRSAAGMAQAIELVALLNAELRAQRTVIVHCWAGLGRAGTLAACLLVDNEMRPENAILEVRAARPGAIESEEQVRFIERFAAHVKG
ncbi:MAG: protein-tyrosine phosphatase family protein [Gammaproteobacteria bacterium]